MEEAHENGKESSHSAHANGMTKWMYEIITLTDTEPQNLSLPCEEQLILYKYTLREL
jgi:hypothetical protein